MEYDRLVYETYFEQVALDQINNFIVRKNLFDIISYIVMSLFLFVKIHLISTFLDIVFFANVKIKFNELLNVILKAEFIFLLPIIYALS